jgi:hypothetical protein|tara:strand:- start:800 stop:910 length:111 start_codon:yes stop_codon:yes gene_type:complete
MLLLFSAIARVVTVVVVSLSQTAEKVTHKPRTEMEK